MQLSRAKENLEEQDKTMSGDEKKARNRNTPINHFLETSLKAWKDWGTSHDADELAKDLATFTLP